MYKNYKNNQGESIKWYKAKCHDARFAQNHKRDPKATLLPLAFFCIFCIFVFFTVFIFYGD